MVQRGVLWVVEAEPLLLGRDLVVAPVQVFEDGAGRLQLCTHGKKEEYKIKMRTGNLREKRLKASIYLSMQQHFLNIR